MKGGNSSVKRQKDKEKYRYSGCKGTGRLRDRIGLIAAAVCAALGLLLVLFRGLGVRFSGFLLLGLAALLAVFRLLDCLAARDGRWRPVRRAFGCCAAVGLALLLGLEVFLVNRGRSDMTPLPADAVIVLGAGVNGTEPSLSLRTRLDKALEYLEYWPDIPAVLTGGTGYGEDISEAQCMYDYLTARGVEPERLLLEDQATDTAENFAFSKAVLEEAGVDVAKSTLAVVTNDFHIARAELIAAREGYGDTVGIPAPLPWPHLTVNYYLREAFALVKTWILDIAMKGVTI